MWRGEFGHESKADERVVLADGAARLSNSLLKLSETPERGRGAGFPIAGISRGFEIGPDRNLVAGRKPYPGGLTDRLVDAMVGFAVSTGVRTLGSRCPD